MTVRARARVRVGIRVRVKVRVRLRVRLRMGVRFTVRAVGLGFKRQDKAEAVGLGTQPTMRLTSEMYLIPSQ